MTIEVRDHARAKEILTIEPGFGWSTLAVYQEKSGQMWLARDRSDLDVVRFDVRPIGELSEATQNGEWTAEVTFDKEWHWNER